VPPRAGADTVEKNPYPLLRIEHQSPSLLSVTLLTELPHLVLTMYILQCV